MPKELKPKPDGYKAIIFIDRLPPSLNTILRMHWTARRKLQKAFDNQVLNSWICLHKFVFINPVRITYSLYFPTPRVRDFDNYQGGTKFITDALKKTFLFRDDSEWIKNISVNFLQGRQQTRIVIEEVQE